MHVLHLHLLQSVKRGRLRPEIFLIPAGLGLFGKDVVTSHGQPRDRSPRLSLESVRGSSNKGREGNTSTSRPLPHPNHEDYSGFLDACN